MKKKVLIGGGIALLLIIISIAAAKVLIKDDANVSSNENGQVLNGANQEANDGEKSTVYMTEDISAESLVEIYEKLGVTLEGNVAVKISTGEAGGNNYLKPELIGDLVQKLDGTIVENNTAYAGSRSSTQMHKQVAEDHGFTKIANVDILDEDGEISLPIANGKHLSEDIVGSHYSNYDGVLVLSHFKGHAMAGFGGALKNISIGYASANGKTFIHTAGASKNVNELWQKIAEQDDFLESMAEAASAIMNDKGTQIVYINVMNRLSVDCDCDSNPAEPDMHDIGILASTDPVALDQACIDLVYAAEDGASLIERIESRNGTHILDYAGEMGIGNQAYELVRIDA